MTDLEEIGAIWRGETPRAARSGRVVVLLVLVLMFLALTLGVVAFVAKQASSSIEDQTRASGVDPSASVVKEQIDQGKKATLSKLPGVPTDDDELLDSLVSLPIVALVVFLLTVAFIPLFVTLIGFDQVSGEIGPKSIRFFVVRVKRSNLLLGKFASLVTVFAVLLFVSALLLGIMAKVADSDFGYGAMALWTLRLFAAFLVYSLTFIGLTLFSSCLTRSAGLSLVLNVMLLFAMAGLWIVNWRYRLPGVEVDPQSLSALFTDESPFAYTRYLTIWTYGAGLLHPNLGKFAVAALVHLGFALVFVGASQLVMKRRDV